MADQKESLEEGFLFLTGKPHVSFSELSTWMECTWKHKLQHIDKVGTFETTPHLSFGSAVHDSNEDYVKTRVMNKEIAFNMIRQSWTDNFERFMNGPFPSWAPSGYGTVDDWIKKADKILDDVPAFLDTEFPGWQFHGAEEQLYEHVPNQKLKFKGFIDVIISVTGKNGKKKYWIIDWKTCGWGWGVDKQRDFKVQLQLILYKNFWANKHNVDPKDIRCGFALLKRDAKPGKSIGFVPVSVGDLTTTRGLAVINNFERSVTKKIFLKNRNSCNLCEFYNTVHCKSNM